MPLALSLAVLLAAVPAPAQAKPAAFDLEPVVQMVAKGQLAEAEHLLRRRLAQSTDADARMLLGVVLVKQAKLEAAEAELKTVIALRPAAGQHLARLYLDQKRDAEATDLLRRAAQRGTLDRDLAAALGRIELAAGNPAQAERQLRSAAERGSVQALLQLARLQALQKDPTGARASLERALTLAPNAEEVLLAQAKLCLGTRAVVPAILVLDPLTRLCPSVAQYHYLLGVALMQAGDMLAAVESLKKARELEPSHALTLVALGLALNSRKLYDEAQAVLLKSLELAPDDVEAVAALAEAEVGRGELPAAEAHARRVLERASGHATANLALGMILMSRQRYAEARAALEQASAADPTSPKADYQLSLACARLSDETGSQRHLALYQQKLKALEERMKEIRSQTGLAPRGMSSGMERP
jgi:tetratricopeptide (TPR) repeat protein